MDKNNDMRYSRLAALPDVGDAGVDRLRHSSVFVVGCGALGSLCAMYLAASGVGRIGIADFDTIDISNLQRQLFFAESQCGDSKAVVLAERMRQLNSTTDIKIYRELITKERARALFTDYDFIIDGSDNPNTKLMTESVCAVLAKPCCIGGVSGFIGQAMSWKPGAVRWSQIFGSDIQCGGMMPCSIGGVLGPAAGVVASVQAAEAIKHITGAGDMLYNKLMMFDMLNCSATILPVS